MQILQTSSFKKTVKKLHNNQKADLDKAIRNIINNPLIGVQKSGDLSEVRVHKFKMVGEQILLAYQFNDVEDVIFLLALGSHENFYRDIKNKP